MPDFQAAVMGGLKLPVPQISPFLESEGAPPVGFKQWVTIFDATLELIQLQQPQLLSDHAKNLLLFTHLGTKGCKIVVNSPIFEEMGTKPHQQFKEGLQQIFLPRQSPIKAFHRKGLPYSSS